MKWILIYWLSAVCLSRHVKARRLIGNNQGEKHENENRDPRRLCGSCRFRRDDVRVC